MRTPITLKIKFKSASLDQFIERYSVDVSRGGIFIRTKEPLAVGTQLKFEFQLQDASSLIAGEGTVVWIREHDPNRTGVAPGMGVRFDRLQPASMQVLERILLEKSKRGDAQMESRFDAGVRASASTSGSMSSPGGHGDGQTPLPRPVPGMDAHEEFKEESTRVMQDDMVQALADRSRGEERKRQEFEDEPTRRASVAQVEALKKGSSSGARAPAPASAHEAKPSPPKVQVEERLPDKAAAGPAPEPAHEEHQPPTAATRPIPPPARKRSAMPVYLGLAVLVAGGAYYIFRAAGSASEDSPTASAQPGSTGAQAQHVPIMAPKPGLTGETPATEAAAKPGTAQAAKPAGLSVPVTTDPPGAIVTVDGKPLASPTPTEMVGLDAQKIYDVRLALKGFHEFKLKLKPKAGEKVDAALVPNEKLVEVSSTPQGADVLLDGKKLGKTPFTIHKIDGTKPHALEVKRVGFVAQSRSINPTDAFESKGDKNVLAIAMDLAPEPKRGQPARRPAAAAKKPAVEKPSEVAGGEEPVAEKPAVEKPSEPEEKAAPEKPAAVEKPVAEKPAEKPAVAEKPAEKPKPEKPAEKPSIKTPSWMKQPAEGAAPPESAK